MELGRVGRWGRLVVHLEEPGRGIVLVRVQRAGGRVELAGWAAAEGDRLVRML